MIVRANNNFPTLCDIDSNRYQKIKWPGGVSISSLKAKNIYSIVNNNDDIISHINNTWYTDLDTPTWKKHFDYL